MNKKLDDWIQNALGLDMANYKVGDVIRYLTFAGYKVKITSIEDIDTYHVAYADHRGGHDYCIVGTKDRKGNSKYDWANKKFQIDTGE